MTSSRSLSTRRHAALVSLAAVALLAAGCGSESLTPAPTTVVSSDANQPDGASAVVPASECQQTPATGHVDRMGSGLSFRNGQIRVAVTPLPSTTPAPAPAPEIGVPPVAPIPSAPPSSTANQVKSQCFGFGRWGNNDPSVPPDSLLFSFKGGTNDGAQVSFFVGDLTGGEPPPPPGERRTVTPLVAPINAQVGVSVNGKYYSATQCSLKITAMSSAKASGYFQCPTATTSEANPFAPSDDVPYDAEDSTTPTVAPPAVPGAPAPVPTTTTDAVDQAALSGWFSVSP